MRSPRTRAPSFALALVAATLLATLGPNPPRADARAREGLISGPDGTLYLLYGGTRHRGAPTVLAALGLDERASRPVSQQSLEQIPEGAPLPLVTNGSFVGGPDGARYLLLDGAHRIPDEATFAAYGWSGSGSFGPVPVEPLDGGLLAALPARAPVAPADRGLDRSRFDWGYCTWWVVQRRAVHWYGDALEWYGNAQSLGYAVGNVPVPGAILVRRSSSWSGYGHVAYVEAVEGTLFTVSEMNVHAVGELTTRTYDLIGDPPPGLLGFIYWRWGDEPAPIAPATPQPGGRGPAARALSPIEPIED